MLAEVVTNLGEYIDCNSAPWGNKTRAKVRKWEKDAVRPSRQAAGLGHREEEQAVQDSDGSTQGKRHRTYDFWMTMGGRGAGTSPNWWLPRMPWGWHCFGGHADRARIDEATLLHDRATTLGFPDTVNQYPFRIVLWSDMSVLCRLLSNSVTQQGAVTFFHLNTRLSQCCESLTTSRLFMIG